MGKRKTNVPPDSDLLPGMEGDGALGAELLEASTQPAYSGKIVETNQARVEGILAARAMGIPIRKIMQAFTVSPHTIAALEARHATKLATLKDRLARKFGVFLELGLDRAISTVDKMDIDKLMVSLGIASDKLQVLTGEPSVIVGSSDGAKQFSVESLAARLRSRDIIDVTPTGLGDGKDGATREAGGGSAGLAGPSKTPESDTASDSNHSK